MADANANYYILNYEMSIDDIKELVVDGLIRRHRRKKQAAQPPQENRSHTAPPEA